MCVTKDQKLNFDVLYFEWKSIFTLLWVLVTPIFNIRIGKYSMCDVTKGSGTGFKTSDLFLFHPWRHVTDPLLFIASFTHTRGPVKQKIKAAIFAEDCNGRLNMQSDNCARLPH